MFLVSSWSFLFPFHWSQVWSREWRWSWSSANKQWSNSIWVINNLLPIKVWLILDVWEYILCIPMRKNIVIIYQILLCILVCCVCRVEYQVSSYDRLPARQHGISGTILLASQCCYYSEHINRPRWSSITILVLILHVKVTDIHLDP